LLKKGSLGHWVKNVVLPAAIPNSEWFYAIPAIATRAKPTNAIAVPILVL
jgi:hypothetical protein